MFSYTFFIPTDVASKWSNDAPHLLKYNLIYDLSIYMNGLTMPVTFQTLEQPVELICHFDEKLDGETLKKVEAYLSTPEAGQLKQFPHCITFNTDVELIKMELEQAGIKAFHLGKGTKQFFYTEELTDEQKKFLDTLSKRYVTYV